MKGKFVVIEGIDGCGKTTQIEELSKWLPNSGLIKKGSKLITTREPGLPNNDLFDSVILR